MRKEGPVRLDRQEPSQNLITSVGCELRVTETLILHEVTQRPPAARGPYVGNSTATASSAASSTGVAQMPSTKMPMKSTPVVA